ncbi:hypothetical protein ASG01_12635 [Chryseobacterium sp. Leaf180]|uniref:EpsG family protein n=1 Tax=Chryseobacterium sp. Leaf180 TaxID=1736289 RepID=UPI0006F49EC3|nr:EpsG family protein [Chryseobacterium sp. Leaf180]KQR91846.1 hypothetical protein ASG01_12635 [Chryseobacterium sp. Leaf180]
MVDFKFKYYLIYLAATLISIVVSTQMDVKKNNLLVKITNKIIYLISLLFVLLFGLRGMLGTDTPNYLLQFNFYEDNSYGTDVVMYYIFNLFHILKLPFESFIFFMSVLFIGVLTIAIKRNANFFRSSAFLIFFSFISFFYFQTLGINIIRQGVSLSFLLLAMINYQHNKEKKINWLLPLILCILFHFTSIIPIIFYIFILYFKKLKVKVFYIIYVFFLALSMVNVSLLSFKDYIGFLMVDERRSGYLTSTDEIYTIGFKPQFVAFNTFFLLFFIYIKNNGLHNQYYDSVLKYYLIMSAVFFITFQIPYSDRWGLMSWVVIPILLAPVFSTGFPKKVATITTIILVSIFIFFEKQ